MLRLSEEVGEVAQAVFGATGQNPRKRTSHAWQNGESELCDVVITALVALRTLTPGRREVFHAPSGGVAERPLGPSRRATEGRRSAVRVSRPRDRRRSRGREIVPVR
ncbi:MazG-like family protein [Streptomyces thermocarboxydus]